MMQEQMFGKMQENTAMEIAKDIISDQELLAGLRDENKRTQIITLLISAGLLPGFREMPYETLQG